MPEHCDNCSTCEGLPFDVDTGSERLSRIGSKDSRNANASRQPHGFTAWQNALLENLKVLRNLLATQQHIPAYTVFSDASLIDMVRRRPMTPDDFLDVSGVGVSKQEKYSQSFLRVLRDGFEPNAAADEFADMMRSRKTPAVNKCEHWAAEEEQRLKNEYFGEMPLQEIAAKHGRTIGAIRLRLQKIGLIE